MERSFNCIILRPLYCSESNSKRTKINHQLFLLRKVLAKYLFKIKWARRLMLKHSPMKHTVKLSNQKISKIQFWWNMENYLMDMWKREFRTISSRYWKIRRSFKHLPIWQWFLISKIRFSDEWKYLSKNLAPAYGYFNSLNDYQKPSNNFEEGFFSTFKNDQPNDDEIERTEEINNLFTIKNGEEWTKIYLKSDTFMCFREKYKSINQRNWYQSCFLCKLTWF